jgi:pimeloyl-ACP methyl ester carboxylesterase
LEREFALPGVVEALTCPLLVIGAGADLVMPPSESLRLCAAAGENGTLIWFPDEGHGLYDAVDVWMDDAGRWLQGIFGPAASAGVASQPERHDDAGLEADEDEPSSFDEGGEWRPADA